MAKIKVVGSKPKAKKAVRVTAAHVTAHREHSKKDHSPKWDGHEDWTAHEFAANFRSAMQYYNLEYSAKDLKPAVINWMGKNGYDKATISSFKKTKDWRCGATMGAVASALLKGMPNIRVDFNHGRNTAHWLATQITKAITEGKADIEADEVKEIKAAGPQVSIQERVREAAMAMTEEIEDALESFYADKDAFEPKAFKVLNLLKGKTAKAAHARIIKEFYGKTFAELTELASGKADDQLKEGYSHLARKYVKKLLDFYAEIDTACVMLMEEAKVNRAPRAKKAVPKEKMVEKLKFMKTFETLKLVSINPTDILGAKELWIYNTKSRKLGKYVAGEFSDLGVKGTSITGFDEDKSVQKTLRKPVEQIAAFKAAGKVQLRKFLEEINAVDTKMNGRINEEIVLLKVA